MVPRYPIPAKETRVEIRVRNSRFIATAAPVFSVEEAKAFVATAAPVFSVEEAKAFVARIRKEFADASHNVPAYQIGYGSSVVAHCNDDGEPSGTAGRPALAVLQGSGIGDVVVVITRYFKLGTGGLVRAYGDAAREVLAALPRAEKVPSHIVMMDIPYPLFEQTKLLVGERNGRILDQDFAVNVTITAQFAVEDFAAFQDALRELTHGKIEAVIVETNEASIMPLGNADDGAGTNDR
jgi:uncharacterized YigZ family protein